MTPESSRVDQFGQYAAEQAMKVFDLGMKVDELTTLIGYMADGLGKISDVSQTALADKDISFESLGRALSMVDSIARMTSVPAKELVSRNG